MSWYWAAASQIGTSHIRNGTPCQDRHRCFEKRGALVAIASDGAGSAKEGGRGASLVCRTFASELTSILLTGWPTDDDLTAIVDQIRDSELDPTLLNVVRYCFEGHHFKP